MKKSGLLIMAILMLNISYANGFNFNINIGDTSKPKEVRIEKQIINGKTETKIWLDGQQLKEGSADFEKYTKDTDTKIIGTNSEKRKIIIRKSENVESEFDEIDPEEIKNIEVKKTADGKTIIIKMKNGEVIEKAYDNKKEDKEVKVMIFESDDFNEEEIQNIEIKKTKKGKKIIIKKKDGEVIEQSENGEAIEMNIDVEVESTENGERIIVKENGQIIEDILVDKNGKEDIQVITQDGNTEVIIIKDEKGKRKKRKSKSKKKGNKKTRVIIKEVETEEEIIIDDNRK